MSIDYNDIKSRLSYDCKTGLFYWKRLGKKNVRKKRLAGCRRRDGYVDIRIDGKSYKAHRIAWLYYYGQHPSGDIDHINGIKHDNSIKNLRVVTHAQNMKNKQINKNNTSGVTGVSYQKGTKKYAAYIWHNNKNINLGIWKCKFLAVAVRKAAELQYGYHQNHGRSQTK